jgi:hypothetical protein
LLDSVSWKQERSIRERRDGTPRIHPVDVPWVATSDSKNAGGLKTSARRMGRTTTQSKLHHKRSRCFPPAGNPNLDCCP